MTLAELANADSRSEQGWLYWRAVGAKGRVRGWYLANFETVSVISDGTLVVGEQLPGGAFQTAGQLPRLA